MNLYFSRKFTYSLYEDHVKYAQITWDNHERRNTLLFCFLVFNIQNVNIQYSDINIQYSNLNILYPNRNIRYSDFHIYLIFII